MDAGKESSAKSANISWKESLVGIVNIFGVKPPWGPPIENNAK